MISVWLSEKASAQAESGQAFIGTVTIGGENAAVEASGESRNLKTLGLGGFSWQPSAGQQVLVLKCGDEGDVIAGVVGNAAEAAGGESVMGSGPAKIRVCGNGTIELTGVVNITGALLVNGVPFGAGTYGA